MYSACCVEAQVEDEKTLWLWHVRYNSLKGH